MRLKCLYDGTLKDSKITCELYHMTDYGLELPDSRQLPYFASVTPATQLFQTINVYACNIFDYLGGG